MNKFKILFLTCLFSLGIFTSVFGQLTIKGKVLQQNSNTPIPYTNIGVLNSYFGTISNSDGSFSIKIPASHLEETLLFSAIGYKKKSIDVNSFTSDKEIIIYLIEKEIVLDEVVIFASGKKIKEKQAWLGHGKKHLLVQGQMNMDTASAGGAMALLIEKKDDIDLKFLDKALLYITRNTEPEFKVRVRFLRVDNANNNLPGDDLINESIVIASDINRGWLSFDLSSYDLLIEEESFFLVFEWILEDKDRLRMYNTVAEYGELNPDKIIRDSIIIDGKKVPTQQFSSSAPIPIIAFGDTRSKSDFKNYKCYSRSNSFGKWETASGIISAKILMRNQPLKNLSLKI